MKLFLYLDSTTSSVLGYYIGPDNLAASDTTVTNIISQDGTKINLKNGNPVPLEQFSKRFKDFVWNDGLVQKDGTPQISDDDLTPVNPSIPMAFKRANTVVSLGRL